MPAHKIRVEICGASYVISTNDAEEYLIGLAERLDADMGKVLQGASNASITSAAVITALGYLDEASKSAAGADNMRAQIQDYLEDAARARSMAEEARMEVERLNMELEELRNSALYQPMPPMPPIPEALPQTPLFSPIGPMEEVGWEEEEKSFSFTMDRLPTRNPEPEMQPQPILQPEMPSQPIPQPEVSMELEPEPEAEDTDEYEMDTDEIEGQITLDEI